MYIVQKLLPISRQRKAPHHWPFVKGIHRRPVDFRLKQPHRNQKWFPCHGCGRNIPDKLINNTPADSRAYCITRYADFLNGNIMTFCHVRVKTGSTTWLLIHSWGVGCWHFPSSYMISGLFRHFWQNLNTWRHGSNENTQNHLNIRFIIYIYDIQCQIVLTCVYM